MRRAWLALFALALASAAAADEAPTKPPEMSTRLAGPGPTAETLRQKKLQWERAHATPAADVPAAGTAALRATTPATKQVAAPKATSIPLKGAELAAALARQQAKIAASSVPPTLAVPRSALAPKPWSPRVDKPAETRTIQPAPESQRSPEQRAKAAAGKAAAAAPARRGEP